MTIQINDSPKLQIPIENIQELGEQVWGTIIPLKKDGTVWGCGGNHYG